MTETPRAVRVRSQCGAEPDGRSALANEFLAKVSVRSAIIVCAKAEARCPKIFPFATETLCWAFDDPTVLERSPDLQLAKFRRVRDEIDARLRTWLTELR